jgi:adenylylsulfate kinase
MWQRMPGFSCLMSNSLLKFAAPSRDGPRVKLLSGVVWLTGLSGAGKSTIAAGVRAVFDDHGVPAAILDGDDVRAGLSHDLGFSNDDRRENIRRIAHVARLLCEQDITAIVAAVTPLREHRALAREIVGAPFHEVFVHAPLSVCERRDVKGLYARARRGEIPHFTGVSDVYESPVRPDLLIDTSNRDVSTAVDQVISLLAANDPGAAP